MTDAVWSNNFNGGSEGVGISTGNSGGSSGTAIDNVQTSTQWTFAAAAAIGGGAFGAKLIPDPTPRYLRGDDPAPDGTRAGVRFDVLWPSNPAANTPLANLRSFEASTDAGLSAISLLTTGVARLLVGNSSTVVAGSDSPALTPNVKHTMEHFFTAGASSTTAKCEYKIWGPTGTLIHSFASTATLNAGSTFSPRRNRLGMVTNSSGWAQIYYDNFRWGRQATGDFGPIPGPPVIIVTLDAWRWNVDVRTSTGTGTLTYSIAYVSGFNQLAGVVEPVDGFFSIPSDETLSSVYEITVTNGTDTDTYEVVVPALGAGGAPEVFIRGPLMWNGTALV
jgi:hypothetical protein